MAVRCQRSGIWGSSTVLAIWNLDWLLHKQEESWKVDWLLHKQEKSWLLHEQEKAATQAGKEAATQAGKLEGGLVSGYLELLL